MAYRVAVWNSGTKHLPHSGRRKMRSAVTLFGSIFIFGVSVFGQTGTPGPATPSSSKSETQATFRATTRMVLVDAVVTGKKGDFIRKLAPSDFEILEDGKPQRIAAFAEHAGSNPTQREDQSPLPPNQFTN